MVQRMVLEVPGIAAAYAATLINEGLGMIYDEQMWSWQLQTAGWLTPGLLFPVGSSSSAGTITTTPYSNVVIGDATASAAWQAYMAAGNLPLFTQLQIRSPYYSLYSIRSIGSSGPFTTLILDRPWMEPGGVAQTYMIYQAYFSVPVTDFKRFLWARDTTNNAPMDYWTKSQRDLAYEDPERVVFDDPGYFVPYQPDQATGSALFGAMLFELWPHPLSVLPYTYGFLRRGPLLQKPTDTLPYPLTEESVLWKAKECAYLFKEAQKGEDMQRGQGADWKFLAQAASDEYTKRIKPIKDYDEGLAALYWNKYRPDFYNNAEPFATVTGQLNIGRM